MRTLLSHTRSGFTLIELMISLTILGMMTIMMMMTYFQMSETSRRLQMSRELSETAREITEQIAQDIRTHGLVFSGATEFDRTTQYSGWKNIVTSYAESGTEVLPIGFSGSEAHLYYAYGKRTNTGFAPCTEVDRQTPTTHCGLYRIMATDRSKGYNLVDGFREDEAKKRIKITDLKFYISGTDAGAVPKVTLKMTLELMPRGGVPPSLVRATKLELQTTFSHRFYHTP